MTDEKDTVKQSNEIAKSNDVDQALKAFENDITDAEKAAIQEMAKKSCAKVRPPNLKLTFDERSQSLIIGYKGKEPLMAEAMTMLELGTSDPRFYRGIIRQVATLGEHETRISETASDFTLSVVGGIEPQDHVETMLAVQMGAIHQATMMLARRLNHVQTIEQQDAAERALNKLARTFTSQVETLKRYRAKADQTVRVERVEVKDGGQAIVGDVHHGGRGGE